MIRYPGDDYSYKWYHPKHMTVGGFFGGKLEPLWPWLTPRYYNILFIFI